MGSSMLKTRWKVWRTNKQPLFFPACPPACRRCHALRGAPGVSPYPPPLGGLTLQRAQTSAWSFGLCTFVLIASAAFLFAACRGAPGVSPSGVPPEARPTRPLALPLIGAQGSAWSFGFCTFVLIAFAAFLFASFSFLVKRKRRHQEVARIFLMMSSTVSLKWLSFSIRVSIWRMA